MPEMYHSHQQEAFSLAFVQAVAAAAGFRVQPGAAPDDDSVDLTLAARGPRGTFRSPRVDLQLKCRLGLPEGDPWSYELSLKNYDDLRHTDLQVPRILVIVAVPPSRERWLLQDEEKALLLHHCAWWVSLYDAPGADNKTSVTVRMPRSQRFDPAALAGIMDRIGDGGRP